MDNYLPHYSGISSHSKELVQSVVGTYHGLQRNPEFNHDNNTTTKEANKQTIYMPRSISSSHSDEDSSKEVGTPYLPTLTRSQRQRFLEDQKRIIRHIIRTYAPDRTVFYTSFDTPGVFDAELEELLGENKVIYEIIFDQTSRTTFSYYRRDIPHSTFTRV